MEFRTDKSCSLKKDLGFKSYDVINTKEQTLINAIKDIFEGKNIQTQFSVLGYRINLYFHEYKLVIEVDELGYTNRIINNEIQRQKASEKEINCVFTGII